MSDLPSAVHISEEGPREGFQFEKGAIPTDAQDRADRCAVADRPRPHPDRVVRQSEGGAGHGGRRGRGARHHAASRRRLHRAVAQRQGFRARAGNSTGSRSKARSSSAASEKFLKRNQNRTAEQQLAGQHAIVEMYKANGVPVERGSVMAAFGCNFEGDVPVVARGRAGRANPRRRRRSTASR